MSSGGTLAAAGAFQLLSSVVELPARSSQDLWVVYAVVTAGFGIGYLGTPYVTTHPFFWLRQRIYRANAIDVLAASVGLAFGLLIGALLAFPLSFLPGYLGRVLPVVASAVGGIADQIVDGDSGLLLADPGDLGRLAELVSSVLASPTEAARLGANARRRVAERFLPDRQLLQYAELLDRLLDDGPA